MYQISLNFQRDLLFSELYVPYILYAKKIKDFFLPFTPLNLNIMLHIIIKLCTLPDNWVHLALKIIVIQRIGTYGLCGDWGHMVLSLKFRMVINRRARDAGRTHLDRRADGQQTVTYQTVTIYIASYIAWWFSTR